MKKLSDSELTDLSAQVIRIVKEPEHLKHQWARDTISQCLRYLECGALRVASPASTNAHCADFPMQDDLNLWQVHAWVKHVILLAFKMRCSEKTRIPIEVEFDSIQDGRIHSTELCYFDKLDVRSNLSEYSVRSVYGSIVREGAYIAPNVILMPSFVNIGAWVGQNTMIDTWATAGSCAQIGKNVHLAGGVGIGGVLEPANARPVIIGDNAFIGSRSIIVEGTVINTGAVIAANVCLTSSTPIYDVTTNEKKEYRGQVPKNAVVVTGTREKSFPGGTVPLQCAYIIAYRSEKTDVKISLNDILRETGIPV